MAKVRTGFVSNSSSTSFCIFGMCMDASKLEKKLATNKNWKGSVDWWEDDLIAMFPELKDFYITTGPDYSDSVYVGRSWDSIRDDETGREFKNSITATIKKCFGEDVGTGTHEESWYNG